jgi:hypothetical protein
MSLRNLLPTGTLFLLCGPAAAHDMSSSLAVQASASDYFQVSCLDDEAVTELLFFRLTGSKSAAAPVVSAQISKGSQATNLTIDSKTGFSRGVEVHGGGGAYYVTVNKSKAGRAGYAFDYHCQSASGIHTGTETVTLQNQ